jgi:hypothetical protein
VLKYIVLTTDIGVVMAMPEVGTFDYATGDVSFPFSPMTETVRTLYYEPVSVGKVRYLGRESRMYADQHCGEYTMTRTVA